jgi:biotin carboxylase
MKGAVLLLGGGLMQLPAIGAAETLGLSLHLADGNDRCPGRDMVDHFHHVDLRDREGLLKVARTIPDLQGVFTAGTDFSRSVAYVAENLGLPGISEATAIRATDKGVMRECLTRAGVSVPPYVIITESPKEPPFHYPFMVKPVDNMGARGVVLVHDDESFFTAVETARSLSASGRVIAEEFIPGEEYSLDALVHNGEVHITGIGKRHIFFAPYFVELGHTIPAEIDGAAESALTGEFTRAIRAIGITNGAAKGDIFLGRGKTGGLTAVIGEIAARLSGGFMSGWTYPLATGVPLTRLGLEIALGRAPDPRDFVPRKALYSVERALISGPGIVSDIETPDSSRPDVAEIFIHNRPGDRVVPPRNNVEKVANVIVTSVSAHRGASIAEDVLDRIVVRLKPGNPDSDRFFFHAGWQDRYCRYRVTDPGAERYLSTAIDVSAVTSNWNLRDGILPIQGPDLVSISPDRVEKNQVSISASELLARLRNERIVVFSSDASREGTVLFWRAFLAGGRQGVMYLADTVNTMGGNR